MSKGSFRRALLELDRELASMPYSDERDVRTLVISRRRIAWRLPVLALAAAAAVLVFMRARDHEPAQVAGFTIEAPASSWQTRGNDVEVLARNLDLDAPGFGRVVAQRGARVARIDGGIHVVRGRVDVDVTHRPGGAAPALVRVSHGMIAVLGTRFTIEQTEHGGHVVLHEGQIRFDAGERSVVLAPGSSLTWPLAPDVRTASATAPVSPAPAVEHAAPPPSTARIDVETVPGSAPTAQQPSTRPSTKQSSTSRPSAPPSSDPPSTSQPSAPPSSTSPANASPPSTPELDVDRVIAELENLRARRRFADAATLLEQTLEAELPIATLERLSYELGDIRSHQLADPGRACRHWQSHRARFPQGRYTAEVAAAVRRLGCEETTP